MNHREFSRIRHFCVGPEGEIKKTQVTVALPWLSQNWGNKMEKKMQGVFPLEKWFLTFLPSQFYYAAQN